MDGERFRAITDGLRTGKGKRELLFQLELTLAKVEATATANRKRRIKGTRHSHTQRVKGRRAVGDNDIDLTNGQGRVRQAAECFWFDFVSYYSRHGCIRCTQGSQGQTKTKARQDGSKKKKKEELS